MHTDMVLKKKTPSGNKKKKDFYQSLLEQTRLKGQHFINRELSWLEFNSRVLYQAIDPATPLLERLRFCNIYINNLDEFCMKRIGGLKNQIQSSFSFQSIDGKSPQEQLTLIREIIIAHTQILTNLFEKELRVALAHEEIFLVNWVDLDDKNRQFCEQYFLKNLYPILTPLAVDPGHPFPFISNLSKSFGVCLRRPGNEELQFARVKIPQELPQWVRIPSTQEDVYHFVAADDIIRHCMGHLFTGMEIVDLTLFRVTRNANIGQDDEDVEDLLEFVEAEIKERKFAPALRLECQSNPSKWILNFLCNELEVDAQDVYEMPSLACYTNFNTIIGIERPDLKYSLWKPVVFPEFQEEKANIFHLIKQKDYLVHHPYESFNSTVERFIREAARDPKVLAIRMTLYRTGGKGPIIDSLIHAAENGKQVACLIELKARFDEQRNIHLAHMLERSGVHIAYGMLGLKIHSKMCLVVREDFDGINTYVHLGTGNYNANTAGLYTDFSLLTRDPRITSEVIQVFNFLTGISLKKNYDHLLVAPVCMKSRFVEMIRRERQHKREGKPALIWAKMNALEDLEIINELYEASKDGVIVQLVVRGFCCLRPGVPGISDNITVKSTIGRFLEHSRVYYFLNGSEDPLNGEFYMGSADWMYRNLNNRVEVIVPILTSENKEKCWKFMQHLWNDQRQTWVLGNDGKYSLPKNEGEGIHPLMMDLSRQINQDRM
jgi:polyphosphate kinase